MAATHTAERYSWRVADLRQEITKDIEEFFENKEFGISVEAGALTIQCGTLNVVKLESEYAIVDEPGIDAIYFGDDEMQVEDLITILEYIEKYEN